MDLHLVNVPYYYIVFAELSINRMRTTYLFSLKIQAILFSLITGNNPPLQLNLIRKRMKEFYQGKNFLLCMIQ